MLFRKMLRDMRANKSQFISIFLMIFLGVFIYAGVNSDWNGMRVSSTEFYNDTNLADVWIYGTNFSNEDVSKVQKIKGVREVERRSVIDTYVKDNKKNKIALYMVDDAKISSLKVMHGEVYQRNLDGIWIDQSYADKNHISVGDLFEVESQGIVLSKEVKGIVLHPEMVYRNTEDSIIPDYKHSGYAFVSRQFVEQADQIPCTQLLITSKNTTKLQQQVSDTLEKSNLSFLKQQDHTSYATLESEIIQHQAFGNVFPIVFLLIAVLTTMTTVSKMIVNQRLQIGILKALGFQNRKVTLHYLSHVVLITTIGAILGYIVGPLVIPSLIYPMMNATFVLPQLYAVPISSSILMVFASIAVCFLIAYIVCRKQLKEKPASALRPAQIVYKKKREHHSTIWNRLNFYAQWNIRDILRNKVRSFIAILGVAGCMGLMVCAFGMQNSMNNFVDTMFEKLQTYDMRIGLDTNADVTSLKEYMDGSAVLEGAIELKQGGTQKMGSLSVQEDTRYLKLQNQHQELIPLPKDGIALSYNMAEYFNVEVNDQITWRMMGQKKWLKSKIVDIIHTPSSQGITMSMEEYETYGYPFIPTSIVGKKACVKGMDGVSSIQYLKEDIAKSMDTMMEAMNLMIYILMLGAVVLGFVVLYNIGTFSYMEKQRDMATLKVLGFRNAHVKKLLRQQNIWLTILGILVGLPFGYTLIYVVMSTIGDTMDVLIIIQPTTYIGCALFSLTVSTLVMFIVSRKTQNIDMVSALKAME